MCNIICHPIPYCKWWAITIITMWSLMWPLEWWPCKWFTHCTTMFKTVTILLTSSSPSSHTRSELHLQVFFQWCAWCTLAWAWPALNSGVAVTVRLRPVCYAPDVSSPHMSRLIQWFSNGVTWRHFRGYVRYVKKIYKKCHPFKESFKNCYLVNIQ